MSAPNESHSQTYHTNTPPNDDEAFEAIVFNTAKWIPNGRKTVVFKDSDGDSADEHTSKVVRRHLEKKMFDLFVQKKTNRHCGAALLRRA